MTLARTPRQSLGAVTKDPRTGMRSHLRRLWLSWASAVAAWAWFVGFAVANGAASPADALRLLARYGLLARYAVVQALTYPLFVVMSNELIDTVPDLLTGPLLLVVVVCIGMAAASGVDRRELRASSPVWRRWRPTLLSPHNHPSRTHTPCGVDP